MSGQVHQFSTPIRTGTQSEYRKRNRLSVVFMTHPLGTKHMVVRLASEHGQRFSNMLEVLIQDCIGSVVSRTLNRISMIERMHGLHPISLRIFIYCSTRTKKEIDSSSRLHDKIFSGHEQKNKGDTTGRQLDILHSTTASTSSLRSAA
jgi:hypothetical protein